MSAGVLNFTQRRTFLFRFFTRLHAHVVNRTRRWGPQNFGPFRKIVLDFGGSYVVDYATQLLCFLY